MLTRELDEIESKLTSQDWERENSVRPDVDEETTLHTPMKVNGHNVEHPHSTPKSQGHKAPRQRLYLSEV